MKKLEHIGIAVSDLEASGQLFTKLLGCAPYKTETVESEGVRTMFFEVGGVKIELLESTRPDSAIAKFIERRGEGIHHLAFDVADVADHRAKLEAEGFSFIGAAPKAGADNKLITFVHPKSAQGVLVELCQDRG